jgi:hypothetical protein
MLKPGERAWWRGVGAGVECTACRLVSPADPWAPLDAELRGAAGASAQARYQRGRQAREDRIRRRTPRLAGAILALTSPPRSTLAWRDGAVGERQVGDLLEGLAGTGKVEALHDRALPGSRANIDHLVVGPAGVFLIDTKRYRARVECRDGGWAGDPRRARLFVGGRDRTRLAEAMAGQLRAVRRALEEEPAVGVVPVLCFVDSDWPLLSGPFLIGEVQVVWPGALERLVVAAGPLGANRRLALATLLAVALPRAAAD